ncbi:response regulator transcription factor [Streptomyces sp. LP05-1]|uniref:Response regulator transcription factor n=1 Tax=Streptomyces pyxinae TaxID=2970734 RepID=A0ABT2CE57_9ACTN|nr:response regulator transcription factor [Streptomyces sp. LP05-1]MCS0635694.1 response regulator transcription factor [Streptomyces sp. LP05-1]
MTRVLVLHSVSLLRSALAALLTKEGAFDVSACGWGTAARLSQTLRPDVCVVDLDCPGATALLEGDTEGAVSTGTTDITGTTGPTGPILTPRMALLVLASAGRPGALRRAFEARALGYVDKNGSTHRLVRAIRKVAEGERFIDESLAFGFLEAARMPLTQRELSVLSRAAEGESIAEIARGLHLSNGTVRNYMASATRKVGARNRIDAIRISQGAGWV